MEEKKIEVWLNSHADSEPAKVENLGSGRCNVNINVHTEEVVDHSEEGDKRRTVYAFDTYCVPYGTEYSELASALIRQKYSQDEEFAIIRQQAHKQSEFETYYQFCEDCKKLAKEITSLIR